jgi:phosphoribosyl 1,2-cyclic phosphodiesterase
MKLGITILGSGSRGNALILHSEEHGILIDAGFSRKELIARMSRSELSPEIIKGILITHEHDDHVKGARIFANQFQIPTYVTSETGKYLQTYNRIGSQIKLFDPGAEFQIGEFQIQPFSVPHDAINPVGFVIKYFNAKIGVATDLGHATRLVKQRLFDSNVLIWESNHDMEMLRNSSRPLNLQRRIMGKHGHLSNSSSMDALNEIISEQTRFLFLFHISSDCNSYDLIGKIMQEKLAELNRSDILCFVPTQSKPLNTVWLEC